MRWLDERSVRELPPLTVEAPSVWHVCGMARRSRDGSRPASLQCQKMCLLRPGPWDQDRLVPVEVRDYEPADEQAWLRCRVLSFLGTAYFDDVVPAKKSPAAGAELVAVDSGVVVGVLDLSVEGTLATIDTIAVHPDHQGRGIGTRLLKQACIRAAALGAATIEAWTRDDDPVLRWYRARGFAEDGHYLHVYADFYVSAGEPADAVQSRPGLEPIKVFLHAELDREAEMRKRFSRVHVCRRFARPIRG